VSGSARRRQAAHRAGAENRPGPGDFGGSYSTAPMKVWPRRLSGQVGHPRHRGPPTYKATGTGLLELLDRFGAGSLVGLTAVALQLGGEDGPVGEVVIEVDCPGQLVTRTGRRRGASHAGNEGPKGLLCARWRRRVSRRPSLGTAPRTASGPSSPTGLAPLTVASEPEAGPCALPSGASRGRRTAVGRRDTGHHQNRDRAPVSRERRCPAGSPHSRRAAGAAPRDRRRRLQAR
jgi:hypothetical protein